MNINIHMFILTFFMMVYWLWFSWWVYYGSFTMTSNSKLAKFLIKFRPLSMQLLGIYLICNVVKMIDILGVDNLPSSPFSKVIIGIQHTLTSFFPFLYFLVCLLTFFAIAVVICSKVIDICQYLKKRKLGQGKYQNP